MRYFIGGGVARRVCMLLGILLAALLSSGCATHYVDTGLRDLQPEQVKKPQAPKPVQLVFEFQTKGVANARATEYLKKHVTELVSRSGVFSAVSAEPVADGSLMSITLNNVPVTSEDDAFSKGFVAGLTFGAAGSVVTDGYICKVTYLGPNAVAVAKEVKHAIHTAVGSADAPANAVKSESMEHAVLTMTRQIVLNGLNDLASDPEFK